MTPQEIKQLITIYRDGLLDDTMPFWQKHAVDRECGGFITFLDADGSIVSTDKPMWVVCRLTWLFAALYNRVEPRTEWLDLAEHGIEFIRNYGFDTDGRMFYCVTRRGRPLRKRRYLFTETFAVIALAEYAHAAGDQHARQQACDLYRLIIRYHTTPGLLPSKIIPETRPMKSHAVPMIILALTQTLRQIDDDPLYQNVADSTIGELRDHFFKPELNALLETVGPDGEFIDEPVGRVVNPGHAFETAWFIMKEACERNDGSLIPLATQILDASLALGWDDEYGGIFYFRDVKGMPCEQYEHDMKLWWPHTEGIYATLLAYRLTGEQKYRQWHRKIHDWAYAHFPDRKNGEWFGYLHRDGTISSTLKGNHWKGPYHLPRMQLQCWKLMEKMLTDHSKTC